MRIFRNNNGALVDSRGIPVRFGLGNDSSQLNKVLKSSDLIGWTPMIITQDMIGCKVAIFTSIEMKEEGWKFTGDDREVAQKRWLDLVKSDGGIAYFSTGELENE
jgi:hypothetical protein